MTDTQKLKLIRSYMILFHDIDMSINEIRCYFTIGQIRRLGAVPMGDMIAMQVKCG